MVVVEHGGTRARLQQIADEIAPAILAGFTREYRAPGNSKYSNNEKVVWSEVNHGPGADT